MHMQNSQPFVNLIVGIILDVVQSISSIESGWILAVNFRGWKQQFLAISGQFRALIKGIPPYILVYFLPRFPVNEVAVDLWSNTIAME